HAVSPVIDETVVVHAHIHGIHYGYSGTVVIENIAGVHTVIRKHKMKAVPKIVAGKIFKNETSLIFFKVNSVFVSADVIVFDPDFRTSQKMNAVTDIFLRSSSVGGYFIILNQASVASLNVDSEVIVLKNIIFDHRIAAGVDVHSGNTFDFISSRIDELESFQGNAVGFKSNDFTFQLAVYHRPSDTDEGKRFFQMNGAFPVNSFFY